MTQAAIFSVRRLVNSILFFIAGTFIAINFGIFGLSEVAPILAGLSITWSVAWCITSIHALMYRCVITKRHLCDDTKEDKNINRDIVGLRHSTHSRIRAIMTTTTATAAMAMDIGNILQESTPSRIARVAGSALWIPLGVYEILLAGKYERKQEDHPDQIIRPCNLRVSTHHMICAAIYFTAGVCYLIAVWADDKHSPLNVETDKAWLIPIPNLCWMLAAFNEFTRVLQVLLTEKDVSTHASEDDDQSVDIEEKSEEPQEESIHAASPSLSSSSSSMSGV